MIYILIYMLIFIMIYTLSMVPLKGQKLIPESDRRKHQINIRLTDWEMAALASMAEQERLPISYLVREGLRLLFERYAERP